MSFYTDHKVLLGQWDKGGCCEWPCVFRTRNCGGETSCKTAIWQTQKWKDDMKVLTVKSRFGINGAEPSDSTTKINLIGF